MPGISGDGHIVRGFTTVAYNIPQGCAAMYYPRANCLMPLDSHDPQSGTPTYELVPVQISRTAVEPSLRG